MSTHNIKARSHILMLLGEELIGSDSLAIFELVKNAYDADADNIIVEFIDLNLPSQRITIEDDGHGMSADTIESVWLTIGTDFKRGSNRKPSPKYGRTSLGNKGVGRLAVHKLAQEITLETKVADSQLATRFSINWGDLIRSKDFIQDLNVEVELVESSNFKEGHGTKITLDKLNNTNWTKTSLRELARKIENIKNPFTEVKNFKISIKANGPQDEWLKDIKTSTEILKDSLYQFSFRIAVSDGLLVGDADNNLADYFWEYRFNPNPLIKIDGKTVQKRILSSEELIKGGRRDPMLVGSSLDQIDGKGRNKFLQNSDLSNIGSIGGRFFVFNLAKDVFNLYFGGHTNAVKEYIRENYGVKIFRDNIRVYNYGEQSDDWLDLDLSKIQRTGDHFARKVTIGAIELNLSESEGGLVEKTNREGFNENYYFKKFQTIVQNVFEHFERIASSDKDLIQEFVEKIAPVKKSGLSETIKELTAKIQDKNLEKELIPLVKRVEKDYNEMRDVMVNSGMTGLNLAIVFHEVDREMRFINSDLNSSNVSIEGVKGRVKNLIQILENFSPILRQNKRIKISASLLVERVRQINFSRFQYHNIIFSAPILSSESDDFGIDGPGNLLISALTNLIDNSLYWVSAKRDSTGEECKAAIYVGTDLVSLEGNALIVADNGDGFNLDPEQLVQPFKTTKPGGMGLGLYFVNLVMEMIGGKLLFPDRSDMNIPVAYNGACVVLLFPRK